MAIDPESRLIVSVVVGKWTAESTQALVQDFRARTGGRVMRLITSDEHGRMRRRSERRMGGWSNRSGRASVAVLGNRMLRFHRRSRMRPCIKNERTIK